jgi:hypothetical protein
LQDYHNLGIAVPSRQSTNPSNHGKKEEKEMKIGYLSLILRIEC